MIGPATHEQRGTDTQSRPSPKTVTRARSTDRAVSPVIGAILMFALMLALLALLQLTAIPPLNEGLEFQHNERVQTDMGDVDSSIDRVAATGAPETASIEAGLRYPPRLFFVNPPPATGTVRMTEPATIEIANASATGETGDYWNGTRKAFQTRSLEYVPDYNEYRGSPETVVEPWVVYNRFAERTVTKGDQDLVDGRRLDLVALEGDRSVARSDGVSLGVEPASAPARTVTVRDDDEPITLTIPTRLTEDDWMALLEDEFDPDGTPDDDRYVTGIDCRQAPPEPCGELTLTLEQGATYDLRLGAVALGSGANESGAAYLTDIDGNATAIPEGGRQRLVIEARDRYDNPVSGVTVTGSVAGSGTVSAVDPVTDAEGRATFVYEAPTEIDGTRDIEAMLRFGEGSPRAAAFDIRVMDRGGSGLATQPSVTITDVTDLGGNQDEYAVTLEAAAPSGSLESAVVELQNPETGDALATAEPQVNGRFDTVSATLRTQGAKRLSSYRIVATVTDADGTTVRDERVVSGSG